MSQLFLFADTQEPSKETSTNPCGFCSYFGVADKHNFGPCTIDAFGDGFPLHRRYKSLCKKYTYDKQKARALSTEDKRGTKW